MTEEKTIKTDAKKSEKKRQTFLTKLVIFLSLIIFAYFGIKYLQAMHSKDLAKSDVAKYDNVDSEIFDLSADSKSEHGQEDLTDMTVNEIREKGAEFVYQMLLKNQLQIEGLRSDVNSLKGEILKYKNHERIGKMIFAYVDLRQKIFFDFAYEDALKNFEILSSFDSNLQDKTAKLKPLLKKLSDKKNLAKSFNEMIPSLIARKTNNPDSGLVAKIRYNISKLVVIRRIDGKNSDDVDGIVGKAEKLLREQNYQEALNSLMLLDQSYHEILANFLSDLSDAAEVQKIDQEILTYLKSLT